MEAVGASVCECEEDSHVTNVGRIIRVSRAGTEHPADAGRSIGDAPQNSVYLGSILARTFSAEGRLILTNCGRRLENARELVDPSHPAF